jgi:hypothetical protein
MRAKGVWALCASVLVGSAGVALLWSPTSGPTLPWRAKLARRSEPAMAPASAAVQPRHAGFGDAPASPEAHQLADWVADTGDNAGSDFVIVDKKFARLYVFDSHAGLRATTVVLLGAAVGDDSVPGIGVRPIARVQAQERTTPAGRFMGERGHNTRGEDVVWVDYDAAVSMHRVVTSQVSEQRLQRLATATLEDKRISYGCINVPVVFYETYIRPTFAARRAPIYVLPEVKSVQEVFGAYAPGGPNGPARVN